MSMLEYCRAMAAFCRQRARFENVDPSFWIEEAKEYDNLIAEYDPFTAASHASLGAGAIVRSRLKEDDHYRPESR
jgi:hypothetical protein